MLYLVRYSEIGLKGKNRQVFEKQLANNINALLRAQGLEGDVKRIQGRILLRTRFEANLRPIFGIASFSPCIEVQASMEEMSAAALKIAETRSKTTRFRITSKRGTKSFPLTSPQLNDRVGALVAQKTSMKVSLEKPGLDVGIEIIYGSAYIFTQTFQCFGGLPVGIEGKVLVLLSDEKSVLAALLMAKRGCALELVRIINKKEPDYHLLEFFSPNNLVLHSVNSFSELNNLALKLGCKAVIVSDTLADIKEYPVQFPVLRPLVAFSSQELLVEQRKYTYLL